MTSFVARYRRPAIQATAAIRCAFSLVLVVAPGYAARPWATSAAQLDGIKLLNRAYGVRDLVLGVGAFDAWRRGEPAGRWIQAAAVSDAVDALATALAFRSMPRSSAATALVVSTSAALFGLYAGAVDDD